MVLGAAGAETRQSRLTAVLRWQWRPEPERLAACAHQTVMPKTDSKGFQNPCVFASLRLCVESFLLRSG
jgi:hypothetical protein